MAKFKSGDTVVLNAGSQLMTVDNPQTITDGVRCVWWYQGEPKFAEFNESALQTSDKSSVMR